jgi:GxxExxY protein
MEHNELSGIMVNVAFELHSQYGPGLSEKVYEKLFSQELYKRKISFRNQVPINMEHDGIKYKNAFKVDLVVEEKLMLELKSCKPNRNLHFRQLHTYLKISGFKLGLVINFDVPKIKDGIIRVVNGL